MISAHTSNISIVHCGRLVSIHSSHRKVERVGVQLCSCLSHYSNYVKESLEKKGAANDSGIVGTQVCLEVIHIYQAKGLIGPSQFEVNKEISYGQMYEGQMS